MSWIKFIHLLVLSLLFFSVWAAFALLVVNPIYNANLPGYKIGRICIWEYIAFAIAVLVSVMLSKQWGYPEILQIEKQSRFLINVKYVYFLLGYFVLAISIAIWQFWLFSQKF